MSNDPSPGKTVSSYVSLLRNIAQAMKAVNQRADVRPANLAGQITVEALEVGSHYRFRLAPTAVRVVERPDHTVPNLFIGIQGQIDLDLGHAEARLVNFVTQVGYFRWSPNKSLLEGVFGAHYDYEPVANNHPAFHAQLTKSQAMLQIIEDQYRLQADNFEEHCDGLLKQVRLPSAQLDFFSTFAQIAADHLLRHDAGPEEQEAFLRISGSCEHVPNAALRLSRYDGCLRAHHWYPPDM